ncbi:MAG: hypothetical protein J6S67_00470 [Methanobrevibacter sp.]|nr:hypothetical protein [Methanobrevibacter sp.]
MNEEEKKVYVDALKAFDELPQEERFKCFVQMENAKVCLGNIVETISATNDKIRDIYFDDANTPLRDLIKTVIDWSAVYMKAGIGVGYTQKKE